MWFHVPFSIVRMYVIMYVCMFFIVNSSLSDLYNFSSFFTNIFLF